VPHAKIISYSEVVHVKDEVIVAAKGRLAIPWRSLEETFLLILAKLHLHLNECRSVRQLSLNPL
jgi:hypothetical protein